MKRIFSFLIATLFLLHGSAVFADVVFAPESEFLENHLRDCVYEDRDYYTNGQKGYIGLYTRPNGILTEYITNAEKLHIVYTYKGWGMVSYINENPQTEEKWAKLEELYVIYDEKSFCEEHEEDFSKTHFELTAEEGEPKTIYVYDYPGAENPRPFTLTGDTLNLTNGYKDPEGRSWGKVFYYQGLRDSWVCVSQPDTIIPAFGGDPDLSLLPAKPIPYEEIPDTPTVPESDETPFIEPEEPPAQLPMELLAIGLVAAAVLTAGVLIVVCYKKNH